MDTRLAPSRALKSRYAADAAPLLARETRARSGMSGYRWEALGPSGGGAS
jgi:hypothetical protein